MNRSRMLKLANFMEALPKERVDMDASLTVCGARGCIAGWAVWLFAPEELKNMDVTRLSSYSEYSWRVLSAPALWAASWADCGGIAPAARKLLGLTEAQTEELFFTGHWPESILKKGSEQAQAVAMLRWMAQMTPVKTKKKKAGK